MAKGIEMMGFPCAGKTYYIHYLYGDENIIESDKSCFFVKLLNAALEIIKNKGLFIDTMRTIGYVSVENIYLQVKGIIRFFSRLSDEKYRIESDVVVEEGVIQALWALLMLMRVDNNSKLLSKKIIQSVSIYRPIVWYVRCDWSSLVKRNKKRHKKTRFSIVLERQNCEIESQSFRYWMAFVLRDFRSGNVKIVSLSGHTK